MSMECRTLGNSRLVPGQRKTISAEVRLDSVYAESTGEYAARIQARSTADMAVSVEAPIATVVVPEQTVDKPISGASNARPGDVISFDISRAGGNKDVFALPQVIDNLPSAGLRLATVHQMVDR